MPNSNLSGVFLDPAKRSTPVTEKAVKGQKRNNTGGYTFVLDEMKRAERFLIMGSDSTFYQSGAKLSLQNAEVLERLAKSDRALELLDLIVDISDNARAPKQSPGLFALAVLISSAEDPKVKKAGYDALVQVARTASTLFEFVGYLSQFQKLGGMGFQKAIARWYSERSVDQLAYQMVKYRERGGFNHKRLLRLSKRVKSEERPELAPLLDWAVGKYEGVDDLFPHLPQKVVGFELAKGIEKSRLPKVIMDYGLSWEMLPTEDLNTVKVWEALLDSNGVPLGALIRQLPRLTNLGLIAPLGGRTQEIVERLTDPDAIKRARIHPFGALVAMRTYASGVGKSQTWKPVPRIVDALEEAFYISFGSVEPTGKRHMLALDISGSMGMYQVPGVPLSAREASACMAMVTARTEAESYMTGFSHNFINLPISPNMRLQEVIRAISDLPFGNTDISKPMEVATEQKLPVDAFVVYTDNEVNRGGHPFQALQRYRDKMGIDAKLIVVGMTATKFTIADPSDPGMLDIAGFDTAAPQIMASFVK